MTIPYKAAAVLDRPRHASGAVQMAKTLGGAAPALYRLLSDSALNRAALDVCAAPVAIVDAAATGCPVVYLNPAFDALFGFERGEAIGMPAGALLTADAEALLDWLPWGGERAQVEFASRRKDGRALAVEGTAGDVRNARGERTHWVLTIMDRGRHLPA